MDILRNIFGVLTSGVVRLLVSVGVLAAAYFFIVKPVLHTADNAIKNTNQTIQKSFEVGGLDEIGKTMDSVDRQVQRQIRQSFHTAKRGKGSPQKLIHCIQSANGNVNRIQRCTHRF